MAEALVLHETAHLGRNKSPEDTRDLPYDRFVEVAKLPTPPKAFGHETALPADLGMYGNDAYGDCVCAGAGHEHLLWNAEVGKVVSFTDEDILRFYALVNGNTYPITAGGPADQGTDMRAAAKYRQKTGFSDASGAVHKVGAYLSLTNRKTAILKQAAYVFEAVGIGINFPGSAMDQFNAGEPWSVVKGATIEGGHYIPLIGFDGTYFLVITWGKVQKVTPGFLTKYADEALVYISSEYLTGGKTLEGLNAAQLAADIKIV